MSNLNQLPKKEHHPLSSSAGDIFRHYLGDIIYGALDGLVTTFAVVSGVVGAQLEARLIIILGVANLVADGFSMGASNYLAVRTDAFAHGHDRGKIEPFVHALFTFGAFIFIGAVPLTGTVFFGSADQAFWLSCSLTALALFAVGAMRSLLSPGKWYRAGMEMLLIGILAAGVAYGIGMALRTYGLEG